MSLGDLLPKGVRVSDLNEHDDDSPHVRWVRAYDLSRFPMRVKLSAASHGRGADAFVIVEALSEPLVNIHYPREMVTLNNSHRYSGHMLEMGAFDSFIYGVEKQIVGVVLHELAECMWNGGRQRHDPHGPPGAMPDWLRMFGP